MKKVFALIAILSLAVVVSCKKEDSAEKQSVKDMNDLVIPAGFTWENSRDVYFEISIADTRFQNALHVVAIYDNDPAMGGRLLSKGSASVNSKFLAKIYLANTVNEVFVVKTAPDNSTTTQKISIGNSSKITASVSSVSSAKVVSKTSGIQDSPTCTTGCTQTITSSNTNLNVNSGDVVCITGNNITVGFNAGGGTVRICGTNVTVQNASVYNSGTLIITSSASVNFSNLNLSGDGTTFINYGTVSVNGSLSPMGIFTNENTLSTTQDFNLNSNSTFMNNGIINVGASMNVNTNVVATNNGSITTSQNFQLNSQSVFVNNCSLWVKGDYNHNSTMRNYGLVKVNNTTSINGSSEIGLYNGAMLKTNNMIINARVKGYGGTSLVKVAGNSVINGGSIVDAIQYCDANGIETNNGSFSGGASQACNVYIPVSNCNTEGNGTAPAADADDDGVIDSQDEYPNDPARAYNNYYPSSSPSSGATVAFEDQWPAKGDYDMNDVVVSYRYKIVTNAQNKVVQVVGDYTLHATGGYFRNGFGVEFPILRSAVSNLTGGTLETGQSNAVVVLFDDMRTEMQTWNTISSEAESPVKNYSISFTIGNGPTLSTFGLGSYNPFIWNNTSGRGYEVHLPGKTPTSLANQSLFGSQDDNSNTSAARYYVTVSGLPWAVSIPVKVFNYPVEAAVITSGYLKFQGWAESGGSQYIDWYSNLGSGYRDTGKLYNP